MNSVSNNREEFGAALVGVGLILLAHYATGWTSTEISSLQAGLTVIAVWLVGFLPSNNGVAK